MSTRIAQLYLLAPPHSPSIFGVQWDGARTLSLSTGQANVGNRGLLCVTIHCLSAVRRDYGR